MNFKRKFPLKKTTQMQEQTKSKRADIYQSMEDDEIGFVLSRPDMYVGTLRKKKLVKYIAIETDTGFKISPEEIEVAEAFAKVFMEVLSNAADNVPRSIKNKTPCTKIKVDFDIETGLTSIWNDGRSIPIEKKNKDRYVHTMIFGHFRTGENYNDGEDREGTGRNGLGIKLCNIFSKQFTVEGVDPQMSKKFSQTWTNNMREAEDPKITSCKSKSGYTCIKWVPDFKRFGMKGYTDDVLSLLYKYVIDVAMTTRIPVYLNGEQIPVDNLLDYAEMYINEPSEDLIHIKKKSYEVVLLPNYEGTHHTISFVNGAYTPNDGIHIDAWSEAIFRPIVDKINKKNTTIKKGKPTATRPHINIKDVKQFFYLFVSVTVPNPEYESQSKTKLEGPEVTANFPQTNVCEVMKWETNDMIEDIINTRELSQLKKSTTKKRGYTKVEKLTSANYEGTKHSHECILIICEGDSAKTYATTGIDIGVYGKEGRDYFGIYPLRGKILNVRKAKVKQITENKVITDLINALGLRYGVDYTDEKEFRTLRYGTLMTLTDADVDGLHILGLALNCIHTLFPTLFQREKSFVVHMSTPIAKIPSLKNKVFFDEREYNEFMKTNNHRYKTKYYKGLGTSSRTEVKETFGQKMIEFIPNDDMDTDMIKVFHNEKGLSDKRKRWLSDYDPMGYKDFDNGKGITQMSFSDFLNHYMIQFSIADCERNIPNLMDGLKQSQRKVLYGCLKRKLKSDVKVASLAGYITEHTKYHHGEVSLQDTIKGMASCYTGGNNLPILARSGEMGSRLQGGKDSASARYVETHLEEITRLIFHEADDCLLNRIIDDGVVVEPEFYVPCLPMVLANPCKAAIGTGWSSTMPSFNPLDIIKCIKIWLENDGCAGDEEGNSLFPDLVPWYRGFKGVIEQIEHDKFMTHGILERIDEDTIAVNELPIGMWTEDFESLLQDLKSEKKIKSFRINYTVSEIYFEIDEANGIECTEKMLKMSKPVRTSNMVLFNEDHRLQKFNSVDEIIDQFCRVKYEYTVKRKARLLKDWINDLTLNENRKRFISEIINKDLIIFQRDEKDVITDMEKADYYKYNKKQSEDDDQDDQEDDGKRETGYDYLLKMHMRSFTKNKIGEIQKEIDRLTKNINTLKKTSEKQIWLNDLTTFEQFYSKMLVKLEKELDQPISKRKKKGGKKK